MPGAWAPLTEAAKLKVAITVQSELGMVKLVGVVVPVRPQVPDHAANVLPPLAVADMLTDDPSVYEQPEEQLGEMLPDPVPVVEVVTVLAPGPLPYSTPPIDGGLGREAP